MQNPTQKPPLFGTAPPGYTLPLWSDANYANTNGNGMAMGSMNDQNRTDDVVAPPPYSGGPPKREGATNENIHDQPMYQPVRLLPTQLIMTY